MFVLTRTNAQIDILNGKLIDYYVFYFKTNLFIRVRAHSCVRKIAFLSSCDSSGKTRYVI